MTWRAMRLIEARGIARIYKTGSVEVAALRDVSVAIEAREFVAFVGPSGSGRSTLLNLVGCLDRPTSGTLSVLDTDVAALDRAAAAAFRGEHLGFVLQEFNLVPVLSA
jgi:putative ABC transport system ATP-binding protein